MCKIYYYEAIFANDYSIAIRSLDKDLSIEKATTFFKTFERTDHTLERNGEIIAVEPISSTEVSYFFDTEKKDMWPIAATAELIQKEYEFYQTNWMVQHGYTIQSLIDQLCDYDYNTGYELSFETIYKEWLADFGFNGEIWASFEEWKQEEGKLFVDVTNS